MKKNLQQWIQENEDQSIYFEKLKNKLKLKIEKGKEKNNSAQVTVLEKLKKSNGLHLHIQSEFTQLPNLFLEILSKPVNIKTLTPSGVCLLNYYFRMIFGWKNKLLTCSTYYSPKEVIEHLQMDRTSFHRAINKLEELNIILISSTPKDHKKIYTKKMISLNPCIDTWKIPDINGFYEVLTREKVEVEDEEEMSDDDLLEQLNSL